MAISVIDNLGVTKWKKLIKSYLENLEDFLQGGTNNISQILQTGRKFN
jgi:hypothetical protein